MKNMKQSMCLTLLFLIAAVGVTQSALSDILAQCKENNSRCLTIPKDCITEGTTCIAAARTHEVDFDIGVAEGYSTFVGIGFSGDNQLGDDLVVGCANRTNTVILRKGFNTCDAYVLVDDVDDLSLTDTYMKDELSCSFKMDGTMVKAGNFSALADNKTEYYLFLSIGEYDDENNTFTQYRNPTFSIEKYVFNSATTAFLTTSAMFTILLVMIQ